jgi:hypothetical protein
MYGCGQITYKAQVCDVMHGLQEEGKSHTFAPPSGLKESQLRSEGKVLNIGIIFKAYFSAKNTRGRLVRNSIKWLKHKSVRKYCGISHSENIPVVSMMLYIHKHTQIQGNTNNLTDNYLHSSIQIYRGSQLLQTLNDSARIIIKYCSFFLDIQAIKPMNNICLKTISMY